MITIGTIATDINVGDFILLPNGYTEEVAMVHHQENIVCFEFVRKGGAIKSRWWLMIDEVASVVESW